jgi:molybdenum cofactor cytidylyltransferase
MQSTGAVILAAGESSRLGVSKQLLQHNGKPLVRRVVDLACEAECRPVVAVLGSEQEKVAAALHDSGAVLVENESWRNGIGTSIRAGVEHVAQDRHVTGAVLLVSDQPFVDAKVIRELIAIHRREKKPIVASHYDSTLGVPAFFERSLFRELLAVDDATGAKPVIIANRQRVAVLPFSLGKIDIDTPADARSLGLLASEKLSEAVEDLAR